MSLNVYIGYDRNNRMPALIAAESIMQHSSKPVSFTFINLDCIPEFTRKRSDLDSTEFSISRFLVPYLSGYTGWSLFIDNDVIVQSDISELFDIADDKYAVMCVKHNHKPSNRLKFLGMKQSQYSKKNWSSVMLMNNAKCKALTLEHVNTASGLDLHQFKWIKDSKVGALPKEWNALSGIDPLEDAKIIHYTNGGAYFQESRYCDGWEKWLDVYNRANDVRSDIKS